MLDVERDDLVMVCKILDADQSGSLTYKEFVDQLSNRKCKEQGLSQCCSSSNGSSSNLSGSCSSSTRGSDSRRHPEESVRSADKDHLLEVKLLEREEFKQDLHDIWEALDEDSSGSLTLEDFLDGYDNRMGFRRLLQMLDVERADLVMVFKILDADKSGSLTYKEFVDQLSNLKCKDLHAGSIECAS
eukprot:NODE_11702_length_1270_cov_3.244094.p1 GENE.NODE_11702_length_1270_cov_3.244094~~NODE_11702_length_1270_cov_3.244094.p1  ORF type:complete len:187 (-),score=56.10 NODE_11702_length_1270_cov_3.244094:218-778(-)